MKRKESIKVGNAQYVCAFRPEPEGGYTVRCHAFPEIVTYGATLDDARRNAREAIELCIEVYRDKGWSLPKSDPVLERGCRALPSTNKIRLARSSLPRP
jgi:antitoxin HicB